MAGERDSFEAMQTRQRGLFGDDEARGNDSVRADTVELTLLFFEDRPLSIAVSDPAKPGAKRVFLPKSQITWEPRGKGFVAVAMPEWLAAEKGLV
jgi:hypothetical protein